MDVTTLMTLMGLVGVTNPLNRQANGHSGAQLALAQPDATGGVTSAPAQLPMPSYNPQGTPIVAQQPTWDINSDTIPMDRQGSGIPNLAAMKPQGNQGGFSTGNILTALLGSNFGQ